MRPRVPLASALTFLGSRFFLNEVVNPFQKGEKEIGN